MDRYQAIFQAQFETIARKKAAVEQKTREKQEYLDPEWKFNVLDALVQDADTVQAKDEWLRFKGWDSYETEAYKYENRPAKLARHRKSYADAYGVDPQDVSVDDLVNTGKAQTEVFKQKLLEAADEDGNIRYRRRKMGSSTDDRVLAELVNEGKQAELLQHVTSRFENAAYDFNVIRALEDFQSGDTLAHLEGSGERTWGQAAGDSLANFIRGGLEMINDTAQSAAVLTGVSQIEGVDQFFANNRERLEAFKQFWNSPQQLRRERLAGEKRQRIDEPLFEVRVQEYQEEGATEGEARFKAGLEEVGDTIVGLMEQPGRILDGFFESLPYMLGVASAGKAVLTKAANTIEKKLLKRFTAAGKENAEQLAAKGARRYLASKEGARYMERLSEWTGVGTVGLTESLSNSATIYDSVRTMTEEEAQNSEEYKKLRASMSHEEATKKLAQQAFIESFGITAFIAGAASKVTGAAAFESRIFSRLADGRKAATQIAAAKGIKAKALEAGKGAEKIITPGIRETVEESIQSGSQEYQAQRVQEKITGEPVGAGVGAATAEGGVLGFVSGAGVSGASITGKAALKGAGKGVKKLSEKANQGLDPVRDSNPGVLTQDVEASVEATEGETAPAPAPRPYNTENPVDDGTQPGTSPIVVHKEIEKEKKAGTYQPKAAYERTLAAFQEQLKAKPKDAGVLPIDVLLPHFNALEAHRNEALHAGEALDEEQETLFNDLQSRYVKVLNQEANVILENKNKTEYTPLEKAIINEAAARELPAFTEADTKNLTGKARTVLNNAAKVNATLNKLTEISAKITATEIDIQKKTPSKRRSYVDHNGLVDNITRVNEEKLEDLVSVIPSKKEGGFNKVVLGLKAHRREMLEMINRGDEESKEAFKQRQGIIGNFIKTQRDQLDGLHHLMTVISNPKSTPADIEQAEKDSGYFVDRGRQEPLFQLENIYQYKREELGLYQQFQSDMANQWQAWNGRNDNAIRALAQTKAELPGKQAPKLKPIETPTTPELIDLRDENKTQLKQRAKNMKLVGYSKLTKPALVNLLESVDGEGQQQRFLKTGGIETPKLPKRPPDLIQHLASTGVVLEGKRYKLDRTQFEGIDAQERRGINWLFEGIETTHEGIGPDELGSWLHQEGYVTERPQSEGEVIDILHDALSEATPRRVSSAFEKQENAYLSARNQAEQIDLDIVDQQDAYARLFETSEQETTTEEATSEPVRTSGTTEEPAPAAEVVAPTEAQPELGAETEAAPETQEESAPTVNIASPYSGRGKAQLAKGVSQQDVNLAAALTNVTYARYQVDDVPGLKKPTGNNNHAMSAEAWYKANSTRDPARNKEVMQQIIEAKLTQYPELVEAIDKRGGVEWIEKAEHTVTGNPRWEGVGRESNFLDALANAYEAVAGPAEAPITEVTPSTTYRQFISFRDNKQYPRNYISATGADTGQVYRSITKEQLPEKTYAELEYFVAQQTARLETAPQKSRNPERVRANMLAEIRLAEQMMAEFPEEAKQAPPKIRSTVDIEKGIEEGEINSIFEVGGVKSKPQRLKTPPSVTQNGVELEDTDNRGERLLAINELKDSLTENTPVENIVLSTEDNERLQEKLSTGLKPEQALAQLETELTENYADEEILVKERSSFPKTVSKVFRDINSVNREEPVETNTEATLEQQLDVEKIADSMKLAVAPDSGLKYEDPPEKFIPRIKAWFRKHKIPTSAKEAFKVRNPKVRSLLNTTPGVVHAMASDPVARKQIFKKLGITKEEEIEGFQGYLEFHQTVKDTLNDIRTGFDRNDRDSILASSGKYAHERLRDHVVQWLNNNEGNLPDNLIAAMSMEMMNWVATSGAATAVNQDQTIRSLLGYPAGAQLPAGHAEEFRYKGTSRTEMALRMGAALWKHTNLAVQTNNEDIDNLLEQRMIASLGSLMVGVMVEMGLLEHQQMSMKEFQRYRSPDARGDVDPDLQMNFVKVPAKSTAEEHQGTVHDRIKKLQAQHEPIRKTLAKYFGSDPFTRGPQLKPPTEIKQDVARGQMNAPQAVLDATLKLSQQPIRISKRVVGGVINRFGSALSFLEAIEGRHSNADIEERTHIRHRKGKRAANLGDLNNIEAVTNHFGQFQDQPFYLPYVIIPTGRIHVDSNTVNYQDNSLQRFLMEMPAWENTIDTADTTSEQYGLFMAAVGLGFDIDPSTHTREQTIERVQTIAQDSRIQEAIKVLQSEETAEYSAKEKAILKKAVGFLGEGTHSLVALKEYADYLKAKEENKPFTSYLPTEVDGKTNGIAAMLMQFVPSTPDALELHKKMANAVGIFFEGDPATNIREFMEQGGRDNYQTLARGIGTKLYQMLSGDVPGLKREARYRPESHETERRQHIRERGVAAITAANLLPTIKELQLEDNEAEKPGKIGRKAAKPILMQVNYSAGMRSIKNKQIYDALEEFYSQLATIGWRKNPETGDWEKMYDTAGLEEAGLTEQANKLREQHAEAILTHVQKILNIVNVVRQANKESGYIKIPPNTDLKKVSSAQLEKWAAPTDPVIKTVQQLLNTAKNTYKNNLYELQTNYVLADELVEDVGVALEETYGHATQAQLEEMLGDTAAIKDVLNQMTQWMNIAFAKDFQRRLKWFERSKGYIPNDKQRKAILNRMVKEGRVPTIRTALSKGVLDQLDISKTGRITLRGESLEDTPRGIAYFKRKLNIGGSEQKSLSTALKVLDVDPNIGVAAIVKAIHNSDGAVNSRIFEKYPGFNVHDAFITGIQNTLEAAKYGNTVFGQLHASYSMAEAILEAFVRMQPLASGANTQLSQQEREEILSDFHKNMVEHRYWERGTPNTQETFDRWLEYTQRVVRDTLQSRAELFAQVRYIDQFSIEGGTAHFPNGLVSGGPATKATGTAISTQQELLNELHEPVAHRDLIGIVRNAFRRKEDPSPHILDAIASAGTALDAAEVFNALAAGYAMVKSPVEQTLRDIANLINKNVQGVKIRVESLAPDPITGEVASAQYRQNDIHGMITLNTNSDNRNVMQDIAHEVLHAMNLRKLQKMEEKQPEQFLELLKKTRDFLGRLDRNNPTHQAIRAEILKHRTNRPLMVSEYISYALTQPKELGAKYQQIFDSKEIKAAIQTLNTALANQRGYTPYRSSLGVIDKNSFREETAEKLESDKLRMIFEEMDRLHGAPTNPEENAFLDDLIDTTLEPGVRSIEAVNINRITTATTDTHEGEFVEAHMEDQVLIPGTIYVAAAGNPTTARSAMSAKEVTAHEILHAITHWAINNGPPELRREARRLFELAKEKVRPEHFLANPATATPYDWATAEARWDHIFNNEDAQGYHEFVAMARSNYEFATALSRMDNKHATKPLWTGHFMVDLMNLVQRIVDFLATKTIRRNTPTIESSVQALVQDIIKINNQNITAVDQMREGSFANKWNDKTVRLIAGKLLKKFENLERQEFLASEEGAEGSIPTRVLRTAERVVRSGTNANTAEFRKVLNEVFRNLHGKKDNVLFQLLEEVLPYQQANIKFYDLLRRSKVLIDMDRQRMIEHNRSFLHRVFDRAYFRTPDQRNGVSQTLLMTDLAALTQGQNKLTWLQAINLVRSRDQAKTYLAQLKNEFLAQLQEQLPEKKADRLFQKFVEVQGAGLARTMVEGIPPADHQMLNAHNIVNQFYLQDRYINNRIELENKELLIDTLDKIVSVQALLRTHPTMVSNALSVIEHELGRNPGNEENAIEAFLGLSQDFKDQSKRISFGGNPVQMKKGHIAEIFDENIELKVTPEYAANDPRQIKINKEMKAQGFKRHHIPGRDANDPNQQTMRLWTRRSTVTSYQKSIMSLRDLHHFGEDMFASLEHGRYSQNSDGRLSAYQAAVNFEQAKQDISIVANNQQKLEDDPKTKLVPILDDQGVLRGYRYMMSEEHRRTILKKRTYFDEVLPRMFGSMLDKFRSSELNLELVKALHDDWLEYGTYENHPGNPEHRFVEIGKNSSNPKAREMWRLLPEDTKEAMRAAFKGDEFYLRDDVVNLVMGFRKLTMAKAKVGGKEIFMGRTAPLARLGEQIFQELMQWKRMKVAILNPVVVVGNMMSNALILLGEGIPPNYIYKMGLQAIRGIRQYQKDIRRADELEHEIHAYRKTGRNVTARVNELARLREDIQLNPVHELIDEGLFTSIVEEFGLDEDSWRRQQVTRMAAKLGDKTPTKLMNLGREVWMLPGSRSFKAALVGTQYGDFVGRYIKFRYDTEQINQDMDPDERRKQAINDSLAAFIYYDLPQNEYLQYANDMGFAMFTKFFFRIQPVVVRMFLKNPLTMMAYTGLQTSLLDPPLDENIMKYGAMGGLEHKFSLNPLHHIWDKDYVMPASLQWLRFFGIGS